MMIEVSQISVSITTNKFADIDLINFFVAKKKSQKEDNNDPRYQV